MERAASAPFPRGLTAAEGSGLIALRHQSGIRAREVAVAIRCVRFDGQGAMRVLGDVAEAVQSLAEAGFVWFDVHNPSPDELAPLGPALNLHPLSLEDCLDEYQIPKLDTFPTYSFLLFNHCRLVDGALAISEVNVMLGERFVITVRGRGEEQGADDRKHQRGVVG